MGNQNFKSQKTRKLVVTGMLLAVMIVLMNTPLGFIPIGPTKATIMHLPVIIGAIIEGPVVGLALGLIFGIMSMIQAAIAPTILSFVFLDPVVAILPRIAVGLVAYFVYKLSKSAVLAAALATLTNTVGVLGLIYLRHAADYAIKMEIEPSLVGATLLGVATANGLPEAIVAAIVCGGVIKAMKKYIK